MPDSVVGNMRFRYELHGETPFPGTDVVSLTYGVSYTYKKGDPGCRYTKNGDGWPPTGPEVEWEAWLLEYDRQQGSERTTHTPTEIEAAVANDWINDGIGPHDYGLVIQERLEAEIIAEVEDNEQEPDWDDHDD